MGTLWEIFEFAMDRAFGTTMQKPMLGDPSGLSDTMWDLIVDALGALTISLYVVFGFAVTFHEAAHAFVAMRGGDLTAYHGGQVSLSPLPHMRREPFGMLVLPILSVLVSGWPFGFASAPYDPVWEEAHPRRAAWMALAGPAANLLLVLAAGLSIRAGLASGFFHAR